MQEPQGTKTYIPLLVAVLCGCILLAVLVIQSKERFRKASDTSDDKFGTFYKTLSDKTQSLFSN